ncbi:methyl-accepting chemotaxis protein [Clostridium saccharobutylicum]|uniref:Methyl-accepting chemotaxis sensory transducer n=2 Tax=Clostridium saccharobutylicum TaxID=169679 RepID=U5MPG1_CLOSA|nr:methyl-accepting chemotaxis protein [Clostridium saccharobutylicum]AGX42699.1 methyl-accepting chemotaxis sensory transducer [Clostridium saccharobutylicum DSM 13864]AQR89991.1 methyl-accepting chemotaxis protein 4 [Clostridium saccharobutylicum]AQR99896.1 methyl-accepting chemotaxis protein 4 [Clostridium saccharobutylicum]AQS13880.1 methyl-accepting chemotaxis protein 4 [Clostridium saccharobutylicum]MBA2904713.1 methyl-accepting chemotaxis protein [Clostridium saccharobutylicum]
MTNEADMRLKNDKKGNFIKNEFIILILTISIFSIINFISFFEELKITINIIILLALCILIVGVKLKRAKELERLKKAIIEVKKGNFIEIEEKYLKDKTEVGVISRLLNSIVIEISKWIKEIKRDSEDIEAQAVGLTYISEDMLDLTSDIAKSTEIVSNTTGIQTQNISGIVEKVFQFGDYINEVSESIICIDTLASEIGKKSENTNVDLKELAGVIVNLNNNFNDFSQSLHMMMEDIKSVNEMTHLINSISERTNLLALNAAIEAANAGEAGKGFSVVATEIRKLAEMSQSSSNKIYNIVNNISKNISTIDEKTLLIESSIVEQNYAVDNTINVFNDISKAIDIIIPKVHEIVDAFNNVNTQKENILIGIEEISSMSQEIGVTTEEVSNIAKELNLMGDEVTGAASNLNKSVNNMKKLIKA